ncbi:MAG: anti-sigma-I factor RsgI family protein [Saccharofermentanales bacterium]
MTPVSAISVDANPSLELGVNRFDRIVTVDSYNDDGVDLAALVDLRNLNYFDALDVLLSNQAMQPYVTKDGLVSITVIGSSNQKSEEMFARIRSCEYAKSPNVECHLGSQAEAMAAHEAGMSYGKYRGFLELQVLDSEITAHDIQNWTMRQIRERINELSDGPNEPSSGNGFGGHGGGAGHGGNESSPGGRQNRGNN